MRLYCAGASPYSRKVRVLAIELRLDDRIEIREQAPRDNSTGFFAVNPLARVPSLETDDGAVLYDSPVIADYLNTLAKGTFIPFEGARRWDALRRQALGDGILDVALPLRGELLRARELQSGELIARHRATIDRALDAVDRDSATANPNNVDIGAIAIGCTLGWLDFRFPDWGWRTSRPTLAAWFGKLEQRPSFKNTRPV